MADSLRKFPRKGILKSSSSFDKGDPTKGLKETKWDEMNILQTLHPPDKDYGHMKIEEPKTPYIHYRDPEDKPDGRCSSDPKSDDEAEGLDADLLAKKIQLGSHSLPKALNEEDDEESEDEDQNLTEEEKAKKNEFEQKRKLHYNEFYAAKLARKFMENDEDEDEEEDEQREPEEEDEEEQEIEEDRETNSAENRFVSRNELANQREGYLDSTETVNSANKRMQVDEQDNILMSSCRGVPDGE